MRKDDRPERFEEFIAPHLPAAYNLARWLTADADAARDVVQEACLRAFRFLDAYRGGNSRVWLLTIVRNTCYSMHEQARRHSGLEEEFDEESHYPAAFAHGAPCATPAEPERLLQLSEDRALIQRAVDSLPTEYREVIVLREIEEFSYKEIASIMNVPTGTVMSRLARARSILQKKLSSAFRQGSDV